MSHGVEDSQLSIGIPMIGNPRWSGGVYYVRNLINGLKYLPVEERPRITLFVGKSTPKTHYTELLNSRTKVRVTKLNDWRTFVEKFTSKVFIRHRARSFCRAVSASGVDVLYPICVAPVEKLPVGWVGWVPDFQHVHLSEMLGEEECRRRDEIFRRLAQAASLMVFSSRDVENDFNRLFKESGRKSEILSFTAVLDSGVFAADAESVRRRYDLPSKFLLIANQFWRHKDHLTAFKAVKMLRDKGLDIPLYCCGNLHDKRNPKHAQELARYIDDNSMENTIRILGLVPRDDQVQIMRLATALVQPTLFEGWSTVVEEGKSLGKTMYISDLSVNIEQNPEKAVFFKKQSSEDLATKIEAAWPDLPSCPDSEAERLAAQTNPDRYRKFAERFLAIMKEVATK